MTTKFMLMATLLFGAAGPAYAQQSQPGAPTAAGQAQLPADTQRPSLFERTDTNRDGVMTLEEVRAARTVAFTRLDVNRDGFLVQSEMPRAQHGRGGGNADDMQGQRRGERDGKRRRGGDMLGRADTNSDGNVTRAEFDAAVNQNQAAAAISKEARRDEMFNRLDANRDGTITRAEAEAVRAQHESPRVQGAQAPTQNGTQQGTRARPNPDTNNDQKVSLAEWLARPDPLFERGDTNNDGRITREEAAAFMRQAREQRPPTKRPW